MINIPRTQLMRDRHSIDANAILEIYLTLILYAQTSADHPVVSLKLNYHL